MKSLTTVSTILSAIVIWVFLYHKSENTRPGNEGNKVPIRKLFDIEGNILQIVMQLRNLIRFLYNSNDFKNMARI